MAKEYEMERDEGQRAEYVDEAYDEEAYGDEYDEEYDDYEDEPTEAKPISKKKKRSGGGGFFGGALGKILIAVIVLLLAVLIALVVWKKATGDKKDKTSDNALPVTTAAEATNAPFVFGPANTGSENNGPEFTEDGNNGGTTDTFVFGAVSTQNVIQETPEPTAMPTATPTATPTAEPERTATPLPVILTNTPTPSPTPTATPTPSPTPTPTATPTPAPTPTLVIGTGVANRAGANVRASASSSAKVVETLKKGSSVTIHETAKDKAGHVWYSVTVDDTLKEGWMRDYVVKLDAELLSTPEPKADATEEDAATETAVTVIPENAIGTGRTNKAANVRKIMNGSVISQVGKGKKLNILDVCMDKTGHIWYKVQPAGWNSVGYVRDNLVTLDKGVVLPEPTNNPNYKGAAKPAATPSAEKEETEDDETEPETEAAAKATATPGVLDRDIIGKAKTNRDANVRKAPMNSAGVVRQLSTRISLNILAKYADKDGKIWYEVATDSGKTHGYVRDFVLEISSLDQDAPTLTYEK